MERYKSIHREDAIKALTEEVTKAKSGKDGIIVLEVDDKDPAFAAQMANAYVEELSKLLDRLAVTEAQQRRVFFSKELEKARDKLAAAEKALRATGVSEGELKTTPGAAVGAVAALSAQVSAKEVQIRSMRGSMTESAPEVKRAVSELYALRSQLKKIEQSAPVDKGDYVSKYREFKYQETLFELMAKQFEIAKLDESREGAVIQVVDRAMPPERKSKPKRALIAVIATLAAGFLLVLYVFLRGALARAVSDGESAEKLSRIRAGIRRALGRS
jgi:tyrosine-protein kinase Etk/Wzc